MKRFLLFDAKSVLSQLCSLLCFLSLGQRVLAATRKTFYDFSDENTIPFFAQVGNCRCGGRSADDAPELP
jgi:hypothetical protein